MIRDNMIKNCRVRLGNTWIRLGLVLRALSLLCMMTASAWDGMGYISPVAPWLSTVYCGWVASSSLFDQLVGQYGWKPESNSTA